MNDGISYEDYLNEHGALTYSNKGVSMLPLLREGKDLFTVVKKGNKRCKAGDVVLYHHPPNDYVLHRIIEVRKEDYVILGDNCIQKEYGVRDKDIIGVMTGFVRNGKSYAVSDTLFRIYTFLILHTVSIRILYKKIKGKAYYLIRRVIR